MRFLDKGWKKIIAVIIKIASTEVHKCGIEFARYSSRK